MNKNKNIVVGVLIVLAVLIFLSGCIGTQNTEKPTVVVDYKEIAKNNVEHEYAWKIVQIKSEMYRTGMSDAAIENETNIELANITKESMLENKEYYELTEEEIKDIQNLSDSDFEKFKEDYIKPGVKEYVKDTIKESLDEITAKFNFSIIDVRSKEEIPDIDVYLNSFGVDSELIQPVKEKLKKGKYIVVVELNLEERIVAIEVCDDKGEIIEDAK